MVRSFNYDLSLLKYFNKDSLKIPKNLNLLNTFLDNIENSLNIKIGNMLGLGFEGQVYEIIGQNKCIKFQTRTCDDYSDIETQIYLKNLKLETIANILEIGIIKLNKFNDVCLNGDLNEIYYVIHEKLTINNNLKNLFSDLDKEYYKFASELDINNNIVYDNKGDNLLGFIEDFFDFDPNDYLKAFRKYTNFKNEFDRLIFILNELKKHHIDYNDFVAKNIGFNKKGLLSVFDLNGYEGEELVFDKIKRLTF